MLNLYDIYPVIKELDFLFVISIDHILQQVNLDLNRKHRFLFWFIYCQLSPFSWNCRKFGIKSQPCSFNLIFDDGPFGLGARGRTSMMMIIVVAGTTTIFSFAAVGWSVAFYSVGFFATSVFMAWILGTWETGIATIYLEVGLVYVVLGFFGVGGIGLAASESLDWIIIFPFDFGTRALLLFSLDVFLAASFSSLISFFTASSAAEEMFRAYPRGLIESKFWQLRFLNLCRVTTSLNSILASSNNLLRGRENQWYYFSVAIMALTVLNRTADQFTFISAKMTAMTRNFFVV